MILESGARLGPYEITGRLGAGGMGEVYRARDLRLQRSVAIKILPPHVANDAALRARFEREARAISALNDPHICALYDVGRENGLDYLVMELCDGATLADRLRGGRLQLEQALRFGVQIARALENAHHSGVIHRDVKPSNIMITKSGVKLLDFGLAAGHSITGNWSPDDSTEHRVTQEGQILGTLTYMAPEVLRGSPADARSDVFALGLVLYEMITGQSAFGGSDSATVIAQLLEREPRPLRDLVPNMPAAVDRLVRSCLAKDPDARVQSAHDVRLQLEWILEHDWSARPVSARGARARTVVLFASLAVILATGVVWWVLRRDSEAPPSRETRRSVVDLRGAVPVALGKFVPPLGSFSSLLALSHDGKLLVYVGVSEGETELFLRRMDRFTVEPVPGTRGAHHAFFSPDGRWIGYFAGSKLFKVPVAGGSPIALAEITQPKRGIWTDGAIYVVTARNVGLKRVPENGGAATNMGVDFPQISDILPGGNHLLMRDESNFLSKASGDFDRVVVFDVQKKAETTLIDRGYDARYIPPGYLIFARGGDLHLVRFDAANLKTIGEPILLQEDVATDSFWGQAQYAVSGSGDLVFVSGQDRSLGKLAAIDRRGVSEFLPFPGRLYGVFSLSPDEKRIAVEVSDVMNSIYVLDLERKESQRVPVSGDLRRPEWTVDGRLIFMRRIEDGAGEIVSSDLSGGDIQTVLTDDKFGFIPITISASGRTIVAHRTSSEGIPTYVFYIDGRSPPVRLEGGGVASISPDEKWIAYQTRSGEREREILVAPLDDPRRGQQISVGGGGEPLFCRRCPELFYRNGARWYAVTVPSGNSERWGSPRLIWETDFVDTQGRSYDVSADGTRLFVSRMPTPDITDRIHLVQNWPAVNESSDPNRDGR
ncbi:MAG TPA: protein kinase [Thermoanaerobaculia bacterium]|nr:protein kinase [Thermoanaerobaculia bacterium]